MKKDLEKKYDPTNVEDRIYEGWIKGNYFHAEVDEAKEPFTIVIPPPNVTGQLHMGHALDETFQDILIRYKKMRGFNALWVPGCDHASISTEVKVIEKLAAEGLTKEQLGRDGFLKHAWEWKEEYGGRILSQLKKLGCACDWQRERFTMDEGLSEAVIQVFVKLYEEGLIYRGEKLINWCPKCKTTISDAEVDHEDMDGNFYHIKYPIEGSDEFLQLATTRPETMLGDTAVAVNPDDERYAKYIGKTAVLPILNRKIPIIADDYVDKEFGTGVVKITPAHDPNDFEIGLRHNLPIINMMNDDGTVNENGGKYNGYTKENARREIISELDSLGLLVKIEGIKHAVGVHERCHTVVEPRIKLQWFVKMETLAKPAIEANKSGELKFIPDRFSKVYLNWLENIKDWCISRQLWWGHRIPAYYCGQCGHIEVAAAKPQECSKCHSSNLVQDPDTLDTWFSSALWPFSTLGWPEKTKELEYFYPTSVLVTAYDIIFFWVVRMVFSGIHFMGEIPFKDVFMHGLVRDSQGRKMSKSLGNGIDPLELISTYGADALRLSLVTGNSIGNDMRFHIEKVESSRNFANKLWNASRFIMMNLDEEAEKSVELTPADKWILGKVNTLIQEATDNIEKYELGVASQKIVDFIWDEYCDWYIEMVKPRLYNNEDTTRTAALWTLKNVLTKALQLLHPFMPFITEEIYNHLNEDAGSIMVSEWPAYDTKNDYSQYEKEIDIIKDAVRGVRNIRSEMNVPPSRKSSIYVITTNESVKNIFENGKAFFATLSYSSDVFIQSEEITGDFVTVAIPNASICIPFADLVDKEKEIERLNKEKERLQKEVSRIQSKLSNQGFISKAPQSVVDEEKYKLEKYNSELEQTMEQLKKL